MPKLPDARSVMGETPRAGGFVPRVGRPPLISRGEGLEALGRGIAQLGSGIAEMMKRRQGEANETQKLAAELQAVRALNALYLEQSQTEDYTHAVDNYRSGAQQAIEAAANAISDPRARANFILQMGLHSETSANRLSTLSLERQRNDNWNQDIQTLQSLATQAFQDRKGANGYIKQMGDLIEQMRQRYHMSPIEAQTLRRQWMSKVAEDVANREIQENPDAALERLKRFSPSLVPKLVPSDEQEETPEEDVPESVPGDQSMREEEGAQPIRLASLGMPEGVDFSGGGGQRGTLGFNPLDARLDTGGAHSLAEQRQIAFRNEVNDPRVMALVAANMEAEVGKEDQNGKLGYLEVIMNRALSRGQSLEQVVSLPDYYDKAGRTHRLTLTPGYGAQNIPLLRDLTALALRGSNITNYATGNESGRGHQPGTTDADITVDLGPGHERYLREADDKRWWSRMLSYQKVPSKYDEGGGFEQPGSAGIGFGGASNPVRMRSDDMNYLESHGGHSKGASAPQFSPEMAARLRTAGETYTRETGRQPLFGELSRDYATQEIYYERYQRGGPLAAPPGRSRHESGLAADIPSGAFLDWMHANGNRFGIVFRLGAKDPVHAELAQDTKRVALPIESGQQGPVRIAALGDLTGFMLQAQPGTSTASFTMPTERRRTIAEPRPQRVAQAERPPSTPQEANVRAIQEGMKRGDGSYINPRTGQRVMRQDVAQAINQRQGTTAVNTSPDRPSGYPQGVPKGMSQYGNVDLDKRPVVRLTDGNIATTRAMTFDMGGKMVVLPTISQDGRLLTPQQAVAEYKRTGLYIGVFDTAQNADAYAKAVNDSTQRRYSTNPDSAHETPRSPINEKDFQHPGPLKAGDKGFDPYYSVMDPEAIARTVKNLNSAIAKQYNVPNYISHKNFIKLDEEIAKGNITAQDPSRIHEAYAAAGNGKPQDGINSPDFTRLKNHLTSMANAAKATYFRKKSEFMTAEGRPIITRDEPQAEADAQHKSLDQFDEEARRKATITPQQKQAQEAALYNFSQDIDKMAESIEANGGNPLLLFDPGTIEKPNPYYVGRHRDGSPSPIDTYAEPYLTDLIRRGILERPPQLDPSLKTRPGITPPWRQPGESVKDWTARKAKGDLLSGPDPWDTTRHYRPDDPSYHPEWELGPFRTPPYGYGHTLDEPGRTDEPETREHQIQREYQERLRREQQERDRYFETAPSPPERAPQLGPFPSPFEKEFRQPTAPRSDIPDTILSGPSMADVYPPPPPPAPDDEAAA